MYKHLLTSFAILLASTSSVWAEKVLVVTEEFAPYNFTDETGNITGLSTEIVREVLKRAKLDHAIESQPWARAYRTAQDNSNVAIYSIGRNEEREKLFQWVGVVATWDMYLYKLKSRTDVQASKVADLKSYILGGVRDDVRTMYLLKEGFAVDIVTDDINNIKKLQIGRIDAFATDEMALMALAKKAGVDFNSMEKLLKLDKLSTGLSMAFSLKTPEETVEKCRVALESMKKDGSFNKIAAKWRRK
mgnify:CR=1 FL=1